MKRLLVCSGFLGIVTICLFFAFCRKEPITSWNSPRMRAMKQEWDSLLKNPPPEGENSKNDRLIEMQRDILERNLSIEDLRRLASTSTMLPAREEKLSNFEIHVLQYMTVSFIQKGDRESLVTLLSRQCHDYVGPETTTTWYLLYCHKQAIKDPILVLGEAYARSKEPEVRSKIAATVRQGFANFDIPGKDDAEYVQNAMEWYKSQKDRLVLCNPSPEYPESFFELKKEAGQPTQ